ncbi:MAG: ATP-binding protein [Nitrospirae bacterium]|nr:ATP-binding protein [Nitrospirota bacterium]MCL5978111.1 ATP-binding protein [Nitrospirota bacterium]
MMERLRKWMFSLQGKFILVASFCIFVFTLTGSLIIISREGKLYRQDFINQAKVLSEISRLMLTNVMVYNDLGMMDKQDVIDYFDYYIVNLMEQDKRIKYVAVIDDKGNILAHSNIAEFGHFCKDEHAIKTLSTLSTSIVESRFKDEPVINIATPLNISTKNWGALRIGLSTKEIQESINSLKKERVLIVLFFSAISLTIISIGAKVLSRPVIRLSSMMDGIKTHGDLEQQFPAFKDRRDEIGELQKSFLWMLQRLRDADREHKKTVEILGQTEKMVSIGRLASGVAHEINNPLSGITLCFKNLMEADLDDSTKDRLVQAVNDGLQKIKKIVEQLLDFSRMSVTEKTPVGINDFISRLLVLFNYPASKKEIKVVNDMSGNIPKILIDENKMAQVFMNILINALQAMDMGGTLTIRTRIDNGFCTISIGDTGIGIAPDVLPNIFDPFFTTKDVGEGTGLGLSVSKGIVEQHGGIIEVESTAGVGTTFIIKLPIT